MGVRPGFRQLHVWRRAKALAIDIYRYTGTGSLARDFALRDQMRRSAISIPSNIAEGSERGSDKDTVRFFRIAKASAAELMTQAEIAADVGLMPADAGRRIVDECSQIGSMLGAIIVRRQRG